MFVSEGRWAPISVSVHDVQANPYTPFN